MLPKTASTCLKSRWSRLRVCSLEIESSPEDKAVAFHNKFMKDLFEDDPKLFQNPLSAKVIVNYAEYLLKEKNVSVGVD